MRKPLETLAVFLANLQVSSFGYSKAAAMKKSLEDENEDIVIHEYVHDTFKETFRDFNYEIIWANSQSLSSKEQRATYGRSQSKKKNLHDCVSNREEVSLIIIENVSLESQNDDRTDITILQEKKNKVCETSTFPSVDEIENIITSKDLINRLKQTNLLGLTEDDLEVLANHGITGKPFLD
ncbi:18121_t:CDS:2 [Gigaspora margarita]|uniref:18121_t:CDS:1 n=1 Tax=Gigaspora margarita TaxID=4874 RepID=A0ABN7VY82_GIGMA|nr:18121_t:CDS:2 [Gigaspora margarita]